MSILPTWPIAAGALAIGLAGGAYIDHKIMQGRIDEMNAGYAEELRVREANRSKDERAARAREQQLTAKIGQIEQEKQDAITTAGTSAAALIERLRNQANSKPARPSPMSGSAPACEVSARPELPIGLGERLVPLAQRADEMRAALGACYQAYDSIGAAR